MWHSNNGWSTYLLITCFSLATSLPASSQATSIRTVTTVTWLLTKTIQLWTCWRCANLVYTTHVLYTLPKSHSWSALMLSVNSAFWQKDLLSWCCFSKSCTTTFTFPQWGQICKCFSEILTQNHLTPDTAFGLCWKERSESWRQRIIHINIWATESLQDQLYDAINIVWAEAFFFF